ncbi:class F sortase [Micrococcus sp.]|uniref:class F sortase n=1 Tax=Micrococcus sp. TaxID=1271 RepID=UPI0026DD0721|nr:class F sortase [Micrococcus sp.]MDO4238705.1 class F sortase [Micrococcus sp.]
MSLTAPLRRGRLAASAAALCLLVAGCGGPEASPAAAPAPQAAPSTTPAPPPGTTAPPATPPASPSSAPPAPSSSLAPSSTVSAEDWSREDQVEEYFGADGAASATPSAEPAEAAPAPEPEVMPESAPVRVRVERIGVDSTLLELGLHEDGTVEVPPTGAGSPAGWYRNSPTPGERGPAVLLGHVGNAAGRLGVFGRLAELEPGDVVEVDREDGTTAVFEVDRSVSYEREDFPADEVYGNTDDAQLRLITCDAYSAWTGRWEANHVVYATLAG